MHLPMQAQEHLANEIVLGSRFRIKMFRATKSRSLKRFLSNLFYQIKLYSDIKLKWRIFFLSFFRVFLV